MLHILVAGRIPGSGHPRECRTCESNNGEKSKTLSSDNKAYQPYQIHVAEIMEIWQFKLNLCIGQYDEDELNPSNILNLMRSVGIELKDLSQRVSKLEVN